MADIAGIGGNGAFDAARAGNPQLDPQSEEADLQQAQDAQAQVEIEDQVTIDAENFADAGDENAAGGQGALEANINDTSTPGGAAAFDGDITADGATAAPGAEGATAQAGDVPGTDGARLEADPRSTNQIETTELQQAGNDNESQTEANRTLGQVVDVFA